MALLSRESFYQEIEKASLRPLPATRYIYRKWEVGLRIGQDHHVLVDKHSYSAPYKLAYVKVDAAMDLNTVEATRGRSLPDTPAAMLSVEGQSSPNTCRLNIGIISSLMIRRNC